MTTSATFLDHLKKAYKVSLNERVLPTDLSPRASEVTNVNVVILQIPEAEFSITTALLLRVTTPSDVLNESVN